MEDSSKDITGIVGVLTFFTGMYNLYGWTGLHKALVVFGIIALIAAALRYVFKNM